VDKDKYGTASKCKHDSSLLESLVCWIVLGEYLIKTAGKFIAGAG